MHRQFTAMVVVLGSNEEKGQQWVCAQHPCPPPPTGPSPHPSAVTHAPGSTPAWKECLTRVLAWLASPRIMPFPFPGSRTFFGNRAIATVTSYSEVTLEQGQPLIQYDRCPYRNRRNTERDTGRRRCEDRQRLEPCTYRPRTPRVVAAPKKLGRTLSCRFWREHNPADNLVLDVVPRNWQRISALLFSVPQLLRPCFSSPRKPIQ